MEAEVRPCLRLLAELRAFPSGVTGPFDLAPLILAVSLFSSEIVLLTPENKRGGRDFEVGGIGMWLRGLGIEFLGAV